MASSTAAPLTGEAASERSISLEGLSPAIIAYLADMEADYIWHRAILPRCTAEGLTLTDEDRQMWRDHVEKALLRMAEDGTAFNLRNLRGALAALVLQAEGDA